MIGLIDWLSEPDPARGIHVLQPDGSWDQTLYPDLARDARAVAERLVERDVPAGAVVSLMIGDEREFAAAFMGCLLAGCTASPIATPLTFRDTRDYVRHVARVLRAAGPGAVLADELLLGLACEAVTEAGGDQGIVAKVTRHQEAEPAALEALRRPPAEIALLQFTSGSTGTPKGVRVSWENLEQNLAAIRRWIHWNDESAVATWLPLYHDMGLIGTLLTPLVAGNDLWQMAPAEFIRAPERWLACFGDGRANITAAPTFGYAYAVKRVRPEQLEGMDFSGFRVAIVGSDRVDAKPLSRFTDLLAPFGFAPTTFAPAYGLAECTLAVTGTNPGDRAPIVQLGSQHRGMGEAVEVLDRHSVGELPSDDGVWLTGSGRPLHGLDVRLVDDAGAPVPDGHYGEIVICGSSVAQGYQRGPRHHEPFAADGLRTGDAGFMLDGHLYVMGRIGDSLKVRGRNLYAEDVESELPNISGIPAGRCAVVFGAHDGVEVAAVVVETNEAPWLDELVRLLRRLTPPGARLAVFRADRGAIPRTSSGKPRRRPLWTAIVSGELGADALFDTHGAPPAMPEPAAVAEPEAVA